MMNDKAQMMVLESVIFAITILVALVFLYQLAPTSTVSNTYTNDLKIKGDDAFQTLYNDEIIDPLPQYFPKSKLIFYLITDNYKGLILSNLQNMLPPNTMYNIYISNGTKTVFWRNSALDNTTPLKLVEPIAVSHYTVAIHPDLLDTSKFQSIIGKTVAELRTTENFDGYEGSIYDVILEMCYI